MMGIIYILSLSFYFNHIYELVNLGGTELKGNERSVFSVIFLTIITCGIYNLYWIYATTNETNDYLEDGDTSGVMVLIYNLLTCGIYGVYWYYKMGKRIQAIQEKSGNYGNDDSVLYLILCIFGLGIVSNAIIQSNLNKIWERI